MTIETREEILARHVRELETRRDAEEKEQDDQDFALGVKHWRDRARKAEAEIVRITEQDKAQTKALLEGYADLFGSYSRGMFDD